MLRALMLSATAVATLISMSATAQTQPISKALMRSNDVDTPPSWRLEADGVKECLVHKRTQRLQCHTRAEWRAIAAELEVKQTTQTDAGRR